MIDIHELCPLWGVWNIQKSLGEGSFGTVWQVVHVGEEASSLAAVKHISVPRREGEVQTLIAEGTIANEQSARAYYQAKRQEFVKEIQAMVNLNGHPNIVSYNDHMIIDRPDGLGFDLLLRMELLECVSDVIQRGPMGMQEVLKLGKDIASALMIMNRYNYVHRDIKPQNIFVNKMGYYKLGDFGTAKVLSPNATGVTFNGSPNYIAPQLHLQKPANHTVDIYSLGIVLYRLLNHNRVPFLPTDPNIAITADMAEEALKKRINGAPLPPPCECTSPSFCQVILKACAHDPRDRYASGEELYKALCAVDLTAAPRVEGTLNATHAAACRPVQATVNLSGTANAANSVAYRPVQPPAPSRLPANDPWNARETGYISQPYQPQAPAEAQSKKHRPFLPVLLLVIFLLAGGATLLLTRMQGTSESGKKVQGPPVGSTLAFGNYYHAANATGASPIEWTVLENNGTAALLISSYCLDARPYQNNWIQNADWAHSDLRTWLNQEFLYLAFTAEERSAMLETSVDNSASQAFPSSGISGENTNDTLWLLSYTEAMKYFPGTSGLKCTATPYALSKGVLETDQAVYWWLRTPDSNDGCALTADPTGNISYSSVNRTDDAVRPVIRIDLAAAGLLESN